MYKLAILTSHPIQYQAPLFRKITASAEIDIIVCFKNKGSAEKPVYDEGFNREIQWDVPLLWGYRSAFINGLKDFSVILDSFSPNALMVYGWGGTFNKLAIFIARRKKIPIFMYSETPLLQEQLKKGPLQILKRYCLRKLFKQITAGLYIGEENRKFYEWMGVPLEKLFFTPYAVENDRFIKAAQELRDKREDLRKRLGISKGDTAILFVGKLIKKKRSFDLIRAYEKLITNNKQPETSVHLLFVGDGSLRDSLQRYTTEHNLKNVHFLGFKNQTELPEYYVAADIFVLPSGIGETWGLVVNEAMCFGLPVIVSSMVGCGPDLVYHGENGYIFPVGDIEKLADNLFRLVTSPSLTKKFGEESFKIIQKYSYEKDFEGVSEAFRKLGLLGI